MVWPSGSCYRGLNMYGDCTVGRVLLGHSLVTWYCLTLFGFVNSRFQSLHVMLGSSMRRGVARPHTSFSQSDWALAEGPLGDYLSRSWAKTNTTSIGRFGWHLMGWRHVCGREQCNASQAHARRNQYKSNIMRGNSPLRLMGKSKQQQAD